MTESLKLENVWTKNMKAVLANNFEWRLLTDRPRVQRCESVSRERLGSDLQSDHNIAHVNRYPRGRGCENRHESRINFVPQGVFDYFLVLLDIPLLR